MITAFFVFVIGACAGSFCSALLFRVRHGESIACGRSHCVSCRHALGPLDLIPVASWLMCRGRCRYCHAAVSWQYLAVEMVSGALFVASYWRYCGIGTDLPTADGALQALRLAVFLVFLGLVFVYDFRHGEIPDSFVFTGLAAALVMNIFLWPAGWPKLLIGAAVGAAFFGAQYLVSKGRWVGDGDITLGAMIGAMVGWPNVLAAIFGSYFLGLAVVTALMATGRKKLTDTLPLGPLLAIGTAVVLFLPPPILARFWYAFTSW